MVNEYGLLMDLDGTLIDNEHLKALSFSKAIKELGGNSNPAIYKEVMGMSGTIIWDRFISESKLQLDPDLYFNSYKSIYENLLQSELIIRPGAVEFLAYVTSAGFKLAIVSGSYKKSVSWIVTTLDLDQYFEVIVTGDDVTNKKPDPECFKLAMERLNLPEKNVVVFEDSEAGLLAARNAGLTSFGIRHSYNQSHDFSSAYNEYSSFKDDSKAMIRDINLICEDANL
jgi:HAD superfamily hydrolase (TIGR01509 family)